MAARCRPLILLLLLAGWLLTAVWLRRKIWLRTGSDVASADMVKGNFERRKELAERRKEDRRAEVVRKKAGAARATPVEVRGRLLHEPVLEDGQHAHVHRDTERRQLAPLRRALATLEPGAGGDDAAYAGADIILVSDGELPSPPVDAPTMARLEAARRRSKRRRGPVGGWLTMDKTAKGTRARTRA